MNSMQVPTQNLSYVQNQNVYTTVSGRELEQMVGVALLGDLNSQLADISEKMRYQVQARQAIRQEMEAIYAMKQNSEALDIEGQSYMDLSLEEAKLLAIIQSATPQTDKSGEVSGYRIKEEKFQEAIKASLKTREDKLADLNSNAEITMLQVQSLVDQRKNALTLLSNLIAASGGVARTIIGNIRN